MEKWENIKGYEGYYQVSNLGNIRSLNRTVKYKNGRTAKYSSKIRKPSLSEYRMIALSRGGKVKMFKISRVVAIHFVPKIDGKNIVNHKDGNKYNDKSNNLEWCTYSENSLHAISKKLKVNKNKVSGVFFEERRNKWSSYLYRNNKNMFLGRFESEKEAIEAKKSALITHGECIK